MIRKNMVVGMAYVAGMVYVPAFFLYKATQLGWWPWSIHALASFLLLAFILIFRDACK